jgi:hypothetical protein
MLQSHTVLTLPATYEQTRLELQRVATHVLARRRHAVTGRFGLRVLPGAVGTPLFGDAESVRLTATALVREAGGRTTTIPFAGHSLADLAAHAECDLAAPFEAGHDTPSVGDPAAALDIDPAAAGALFDWLGVGARALDTVLAGRDAGVAQLWPEHFDLGLDMGLGGGVASERRCNLGCSPGDGFSADPYLYVGPWGPERPGDGSFWNAPFGAVLTRARVLQGEDAVAFLREGLGRLTTAG